MSLPVELLVVEDILLVLVYKVLLLLDQQLEFHRGQGLLVATFEVYVGRGDSVLLELGRGHDVSVVALCAVDYCDATGVAADNAMVLSVSPGGMAVREQVVRVNPVDARRGLGLGLSRGSLAVALAESHRAEVLVPIDDLAHDGVEVVVVLANRWILLNLNYYLLLHWLDWRVLNCLPFGAAVSCITP